MERVHSGRNAVLEMLTSGAELEEILTTIAKAGEEFSEDWRCSILLLDREAGCLRHGAVPSMPDAYNSAIDGLPIGKGVACCGTAAATGERMFIEDVMTHPYWEPYRELAKSVNIRGCWSEPILSPEREILGTFGVYLREPGLPNEAETAFIQSTGHFAGMAIERKRSAAALRRSEALFRSSVDNARSVIGCLTVEGTVTEWNLEAERVFGIAREEAIGRYYPSLRYPVEIREAVRERMEWVLQGNEIRDYETEVRHRNGSEQTLLWNISPLKDDEGKVTGMICSGQNITEYKQLQAQMQHAQKLESLGVLAGGIAHDFNNLLVGILGNADLVKAELGEDSPAAAGVDLIRRSAQRAVHLTQQMLAYAGKGQATVEQQDLSTLVKDMCDLLRISVSKNVVIREDFGVGLPAIEADASQLQQVVMNLITNASEAIGEENGVIALTTGTVKADEGFMSEAYGDSPPEPGEYVYLRVEDTGCGMDAETSAKMFDPFFTTKFTGRGLGMAAVLGIIRGHRGAIKVESEVGKGTTIWILLPKGSRAVRESVRLAAQPARVRAGRTILVVDDEETVLSVSRRVLEGAGFGVLCASNGLEGIEVFRQRQAEIDVVLLDMTMPKMGGKETLAALRKVQPDARVVLTSGYDEANVANDFENGMGRPVFLQKPFGAGRLLEVIHQALASGDGAEGVRESAAVLRN
jgi:PAS domain S-box-containing protein